jgi:uncharacterized protein DUF6519
MRGDFSRVTFDPAKHYTAVLTGQGEVVLDAPSNEDRQISLHLLRTLAADLIGRYGGPAGGSPFQISLLGGGLMDLAIQPGRYYVNGLLCEAEANPEPTYYTQPDLVLDPERAEDRLPDMPFVVYLRVWERYVTSLEDPSIREVALGSEGPDAGSRAKLVWQVLATSRSTPDPDGPELGETPSKESVREAWAAFEQDRAARERPHLCARVDPGSGPGTDPCIMDPESRYRREENQLYRVEIHSAASGGAPATFKWSRENGSVVAAIESLSGAVATVRSLGRDGGRGLAEGDWVEIVDDTVALTGAPGALRRVKTIDAAERRVTLDSAPPQGLGSDPALHPLLRRWDYRRRTAEADGTGLGPDNAIEIPDDDERWMNLEDGVQVRFSLPGDAAFSPGDYWLIPARTATGDVEWPRDEGNPRCLPPAGVEYHYAPLALVRSTWENGVDDLRSEFSPLAVEL